MSRKRFSIGQRKKVYYKYNRHCAYCGCKLVFFDMKIDHINPYSKFKNWIRVNMFENLNPACEKCNTQKKDFSIEQFRKQIEIKERHKVSFYYERCCQGR